MASPAAAAGGAIRLVAERGPGFGPDSGSPRPVGRIGGAIGLAPGSEALGRLGRALGPGGSLLVERGGGTPAIVADWDGVRIGSAPVRHPARLIEAGAASLPGRLAELDGAFVLAWTGGDGALHLARDAIGERSLFYAPLPGGLVFGPSVAALVASGLVEPRIDAIGLATYLSYAYLPGRRTLVEGLFELLPGELLTWRAGHLERRPFWTLPSEPEAAEPPDEDALSLELRRRLEQAVHRRLPDAGPVGALLSGGLDSSLVVALARRLHRDEVQTWSVCFGAGHRDELPFSSRVARHCGTRHRVLELPADVVLHHLDDALGLLGGPNGDPLTVPNALLFRAAARETPVILNGEGGDPCFGGPKNLPMLLSALYGDTLGPAGRFDRHRAYLRAHQKCWDDLEAMLEPGLKGLLRENALEEQLDPWFEDRRWPSFVTRLMAINVAFKGAHHILPKVDGESFPFGALPRSPIFDRAVVELAFRIPPTLKLHGSVEKYVLKRAVADLLPDAILERPKSGMLVPVEAWFRGPMRAAARERLLDGLAARGLVRRAWLEELLEGRGTGLRPRRGIRIWLLVALEAWLRRALDRRA